MNRGPTVLAALAVALVSAAPGCGKGGGGGGGTGGAGSSGAGSGSGGQAGERDAAVDSGASGGAGMTSDAAINQPPPVDVASPVDAPPPSCTPGAGTQMVGTASLLDNRTCLLWQRQVAAMLMTNKQAARYCDELSQDSFTDWRVPAPEELATWPNLAENGNAYITNPIYVPVASTDADGCMVNSHSCNISRYNATTTACAWQGVGFAGPTVCVRGTATAGTLAAAFAAAACAPCKDHVAGGVADFRMANCLSYAGN